MQTDIFLLSEKTLKSSSYINDNVDGMYLLPTIQFAQDAGLQPILGTNLFNKIKELVRTEQIEGTDYQTLLDDYITNYLINKVMAELPYPLLVKFRNSGMDMNNNDGAVKSTLNECQYLTHYYDNRSAFYANRLTEYLIANSSKFPEYHKKSSCSDMSARDNINTIIHFRR